MLEHKLRFRANNNNNNNNTGLIGLSAEFLQTEKCQSDIIGSLLKHSLFLATLDALKIQIKVSQNSQENTYASVSFFNKNAGLRPATLLKNRLRHRCFSVNFVKFFGIPFWKATVSQNMKAFKLQVSRN